MILGIEATTATTIQTNIPNVKASLHSLFISYLREWSRVILNIIFVWLVPLAHGRLAWRVREVFSCVYFIRNYIRNGICTGKSSSACPSRANDTSGGNRWKLCTIFWITLYVRLCSSGIAKARIEKLKKVVWIFLREGSRQGFKEGHPGASPPPVLTYAVFLLIRLKRLIICSRTCGNDEHYHVAIENYHIGILIRDTCVADSRQTCKQSRRGGYW